MPRFFFNVYDGVSPYDAEGTELSSIEEARREAMLLAGALLQEARNRPMLDDWRLEVLDEQRRICFGLTLSVFQTSSSLLAKNDLPREDRI